MKDNILVLARKSMVSAVIAVLITSVALMLCLTAGCGGDSAAEKQKAYRAEWLETMKAFEARVSSDDKKASELAAKNDISGLMKLVRLRSAHMDEVIGEVLALYPPDELRVLQAVTLYYLVSLKKQLEDQNLLNDAILSGRPAGDLKSISDASAMKTQALGRELGIELQRAGMQLDGGSTDSAPAVPGVPEGQKD